MVSDTFESFFSRPVVRFPELAFSSDDGTLPYVSFGREVVSQDCASEFIPVSVSTLLPADEAGINLFQRDDSGERFVLYCADDHPLMKADLSRLRARGVK